MVISRPLNMVISRPLNMVISRPLNMVISRPLNMVDIIISFQWFRFFIAVSTYYVALSSVLLFSGAIGLQEQDFVGCFVMTHHMTCQTKTSLSHDGGDP